MKGLKRLLTFTLALCMIFSMRGQMVFAEEGAVISSDVSVNVSLSEDITVAPFLITDEATLRQALEDESLNVLPIQNDILLESNEALTVPDGRKCTIISATGAMVKIYPSLERLQGRNLFEFYQNDEVDITFKLVELNGNSAGGGIGVVSSNLIQLTGVIVKDCRTAGVEVAGSSTVTLNDCVVSSNTSIAGCGGVVVSGGSTCTMNGGEIRDNRNNVYGGGGVHVEDGTFILNSGEISYNVNYAVGSGGVYLEEKGTFIMTGGEICNNQLYGWGGGGVFVDGGSFVMKSGSIRGNSVVFEGGGGVYIKDGEFSMTGGEISDNIANGIGGNGGGVYLEGGIFDMNGGKISRNTADRAGGGVCIVDGTFNMTRSTISGNTVIGVAGPEPDTTAGYGGGVCVFRGKFIMTDSEISSNAVNGDYGDGGGVYINGASLFTINSGKISDNTASNNGGGVYIDRDASVEAFSAIGDVYFSGNKANIAYWIEKDSTHVYNDRTAAMWKEIYDTQSFSTCVKSLSAPPEGCAPFTYMYNNYDVNYVGSAAAAISPGTEKLIFDNRTSISTLVYDAVASPSDQMLSLTGDKPVIKVYNSTDDLWELKVSYDEFKVDGVLDNELKFALRDADNLYNIIVPDDSHTAYTASEIRTEDFLIDVPWGDGDDDLLKVYMPKNRYDLSGKTISTTVYWSLEIAP